MKKEILILIVLSLIIVILLLLLVLPFDKKNIVNNNVVDKNDIGIEIYSPKPNEEISSPLIIKGRTMGKGWNGFEGQVGTVKLQDKNGNLLAQTYLPAVTDWMSQKVEFEAKLDFVSENETEGLLIFKNENASALPEKDKEFIFPVKIAKTNNMSVFVYFSGNLNNENYDCSSVEPVKRFVPKTAAPARSALEELLKGPTEKEKGLFLTSINLGVKIQKLIIENETAFVDFDNQLQNGVGGSCRVTAIRAQITKTLQQFETVKNVVISINGKTEDILQP